MTVNPAGADRGWIGVAQHPGRPPARHPDEVSPLADVAAWTVDIDAETADLLVVGARAHSRGDLTAAVVPPDLVAALHGARRDLLHGSGVVLLRGLPVDELTTDEQFALCTSIGEGIGVPIRQNDAGERIVRVRDEGKDFSVKGVRSYETAAPLAYHSDSSDVVGLYCVRAARSGGASTIVSSVAVHHAMWEARPDLAALLHEPWPTASIIEQIVHQQPICAVNDAGEVFTRYGRLYVETAADYDPNATPLRPEQIEALDLYDSLLAAPEFAVDMHFRPGDLQLLNNYRVMHSRQPYVDWPESERRRELLRIWLVVADLDVPEVFADSGFVPRSEALA